MKSKYLVFIGMGFELVGIMITSLYVGKALDDKFLLKGLAMIALSMLGLVGWITHIVILARRIDNEEEQLHKNKAEP